MTGSDGARPRLLCPGRVAFEVARSFAHPRDEVFAQLTTARALERLFVARASGDLTTGELVTWEWREGAASRLRVQDAEPPERASFTWHAHEVDHDTRVTLAVEERRPSGCEARIAEEGWRDDEEGLRSAFSHAQAWTELLLAADLWLRHGLVLPGRGC